LRGSVEWLDPERLRKRGLMKSSDWIGWMASAVLLLTIGRQVFTQWKSNSSAGVSRWLFAGQVTASVGFTIYSYLLNNWVFLCSNAALICTAVLGQWLYWRNKNEPRPGRRSAAHSRC
jgi:MtN3 and saliva related transmembrane protein